MNLPIQPPYLPMELDTASEIPSGPDWQFEPKWDGFRCLAFRSDGELELQSKSGQTLGRYFPEVIQALLDLGATRFVLDGELMVPVDGGFSFDDLLQRIHPAESRINKLSVEHPAKLIVFDLLVDTRGSRIFEKPLRERRKLLEAFAERYFRGSIHLSRATTDLEEAKSWFQAARLRLSFRPARLCAQDQKVAYSGLRDRRLSLFRKNTAGRLAAARPVW
jgi:ATP-dependent DNA ligase